MASNTSDQRNPQRSRDRQCGDPQAWLACWPGCLIIPPIKLPTCFRGAGRQATSQSRRRSVNPCSALNRNGLGSWPDAYESWHAFRLKILLLIVALLLLVSVVFSFACGFTFMDTALIMISQTILQGSYFLGLVIRDIFAALIACGAPSDIRSAFASWS
jgi:hypothetical protein